MKRILPSAIGLLIALALSGLLGLVVLQSKAAAPPALAIEHGNQLHRQVVNPSLMLSVAGEPVGTGTALDGGRILTCHHVLTKAHGFDQTLLRDGDAEPVIKQTHYYLPVTAVAEVNGERITRTAHVQHTDEPNDLAVLTFDGDGIPTARLCPRRYSVRVGQACYWSGQSYLEWNTQRGMINRQLPDHVVFNGPVWFGHSGSGLYVRDRKGYALAGVVSALYGTTPNAPACAVPIDTVHDFLERANAQDD